MTIIRVTRKQQRAHYEQADAQDEYAIAQECLIRDRNERAIKRTNDEAHETTPVQRRPSRDEAEARNHKTTASRGKATESSCSRDVTRNDVGRLRQDKPCNNAGHRTSATTAGHGTGTTTDVDESETAHEAALHRINSAAPIKRRRNIVAGLLSVVDADHAHHTPASDWLRYAQAQPPLQMWLPCVHCVKGGSRTLMVCIRADLSVSVQCVNEDCEANHTLEYSAPDRDQMSWLAKEGANWLALYREHARKTEKPWLYVWIGKDRALTHGPASKTLKTLLRIFALVRKESRWRVALTREWIDEHGWTAHGDVPYRHDGDPVPILLRINLAYIGKQVRLSEKQVAKYLRMMVRLGLLRVVARLEHGQIVHQAGWWFHKGEMPHSHPMWFMEHSQKWKRRLRHVSSGHIRLQ